MWISFWGAGQIQGNAVGKHVNPLSPPKPVRKTILGPLQPKLPHNLGQRRLDMKIIKAFFLLILSLLILFSCSDQKTKPETPKRGEKVTRFTTMIKTDQGWRKITVEELSSPDFEKWVKEGRIKNMEVTTDQ